MSPPHNSPGSAPLLISNDGTYLQWTAADSNHWKARQSPVVDAVRFSQTKTTHVEMLAALLRWIRCHTVANRQIRGIAAGVERNSTAFKLHRNRVGYDIYMDIVGQCHSTPLALLFPVSTTQGKHRITERTTNLISLPNYDYCSIKYFVLNFCPKGYSSTSSEVTKVMLKNRVGLTHPIAHSVKYTNPI